MDVSNYKDKIEKYFQDYFNNKGHFNKAIYEAMYYSIKVGGKRIRPILMLMSYSLYKEDYESIVPLASALEMIHTYSLIHDDLPCMDDDDLRRGMPTNHKVYGEALAVLAGDALLNEAYNIMFNYCLEKGEKAVKASKVICEASGCEGMIAGQVVDMQSEGKTISAEELHYMHSKKTGELIKAAIVSGALISGSPEKDLNILRDFGEKLGLAFQIKDDILDIEGNSEILGKNINSDNNNNKSTFVTLYGLEQCKKKSLILKDECIALLKDLQKDTKDLEQLTLFLTERNY